MLKLKWNLSTERIITEQAEGEKNVFNKAEVKGNTFEVPEVKKMTEEDNLRFEWHFP